jgi:hypothetical protein
MIAARSRARRVITVHRVEPSGLDRRYGRCLGCESICCFLDSGNAAWTENRHAGHGLGQVELDTRTILHLLLLRPSQPHFEIHEIGSRHAWHKSYLCRWSAGCLFARQFQSIEGALLHFV